MNWWLFGPLLWVGLAVLLGGAAALSGRWYRSSDRQTELDRMIRKQRRRDARQQRRFARKCSRLFGRPR